MLLGLTLVFAVALAVDCDPVIAGCAECDSSKTACTRCDPAGATPYLKKKNPSDSTGTCVTADGCTANNDHYTDSSTTNAKECKPCGQGQKPNADGTKCFACPNSGATANCARCDKENVCAVCGSSKYLTPTGQCISDCAALSGYYDDNNSKTCKKCDSTCLTCSGAGADKCKSCTANTYFLGAEDGQAGKCVSCGDAVTGSGAWKGIAGCAKCTKPAAPGTVTCDECTTDYLKTDTTGSAPITTCVTADKCGEGFFATTVGSVKKCVSCSDKTNGVDGCEKCTAPGEGKNKPTCTKCSGKYLKIAADGTTTCVEQGECTSDSFPVENTSTGNKCLSCGDTTNGVPNCAKCSPPTTAGQKPTCSECSSGYKLEGEACVPAGTNLSPGVIAGISVAAVVVVGGLVGFLCWWFVCRGKA